MNIRRHLSTQGVKHIQTLGLTREQVYWINHHFQSMVEDLAQPPRRADVRHELKKVAGHLREIDKWCSKAKNSAFRSASKVAIGHIGIAASSWLRINDVPHPEDSIPDRMDIHVLVRSLLQIVQAAQVNFPSNEQSPKRSAIKVIELIEAAINRPQDDDSKRVAQKFKVRRGPSSPFFELAEIIFHEATGLENHSPDNAIRGLLAKRAKVKPSLSGE
jgi:hypothetical protein